MGPVSGGTYSFLLIPKDTPASAVPPRLESRDQSGGTLRASSPGPTQSTPRTQAESTPACQPTGPNVLTSGSPGKWLRSQDSSSPAKTLGRFSVVSTQDEWTVASPQSLRYSAPPDVYLDQLPHSPDPKLGVRRAQTAVSIETGAGEPVSSDSADESPRPRPSTHKHGSLHGAGAMAEDLVTKAATFLAGPSLTGSPGLGTASRTGVKVPTISITSFNSQSSYISSDNDSEMEDADIRKELQSLREK